MVISWEDDVVVSYRILQEIVAADRFSIALDLEHGLCAAYARL